MSKNKRILIALCISLVLVIVFNILYNKSKSKEQINAIMIVENIVTGEQITKDKIKHVTVSQSDTTVNFLETLPTNSFAKAPLYEGQLLTQDVIVEMQNNEDNEYEYIALPITQADDAVAYRLQKGSKVNIYYTAKANNVSEAIGIDTAAVYSSKAGETSITTKLYENIEVVDTLSSTGEANKIFTQVLFRIKKQEISRLVCLKQFGTFTLTSSN